MMCDQGIVDVSTYVSRDGRSSYSVQELLPLLDEVDAWTNQQIDLGNHILSLDTLELGRLTHKFTKTGIYTLEEKIGEDMALTHL